MKTKSVVATLFLALIGVGAGVGRAQDANVPIVAGLVFPAQGQWYVFWGGDTPRQNAHHAVLAQRYALDLVKTTSFRGGLTHRGDGKRNEDYLCWNQPVVSPVSGKVTIVVNGVPDNLPGEMNPQMVYGNVVMIQEDAGPVAVLAHFKLNSIRVKVGQRVKAGQLIGFCGNSGNSSEPHLHFHVQSRNGFEKGRGMKPYFKKVMLNGKPQTFVSPEKNDAVGP